MKTLIVSMVFAALGAAAVITGAAYVAAYETHAGQQIAQTLNTPPHWVAAR